jgi:hypothetical protein
MTRSKPCLLYEVIPQVNILSCSEVSGSVLSAYSPPPMYLNIFCFAAHSRAALCPTIHQRDFPSENDYLPRNSACDSPIAVADTPQKQAWFESFCRKSERRVTNTIAFGLVQRLLTSGGIHRVLTRNLEKFLLYRVSKAANWGLKDYKTSSF